MKSKKNFTLLELLIVLCLISLMGGAFLTAGKSFLESHKYQTSCERFADELSLTAFIAKSYQIDVDLILETNAKGLTLKRQTDEPFAKKSFFSKVELENLYLYPSQELEKISFYASLPLEKDFYLTTTSKLGSAKDLREFKWDQSCIRFHEKKAF